MKTGAVSLSVALGTAVVSGLLVPRAALAQISPGPLSRPHAALEGSDACFQCHTPSRGVDADKCLACHTTLASRIEQGLGLHAGKEYADCATCHMEHNGVEFELVWWGDKGIQAFDHRQTGFELQGAHGQVRCRQCHRAALIGNPDPLGRAGKNLGRTFLGLDTGCASCHFDQHRGQFGDRNCDSCHQTEAWKPAVLFDHDDTGFPLSGGHSKATCADCHTAMTVAPATDRLGKPQGTRTIRYVGLEAGNCTSCHFDEHRGQFAANRCRSCHAADRWSPAVRFDHRRTRYPLTGRHRQVGCADCHRPDHGAPDPRGDTAFLRFRPVGFSDCDSCHTDPHGGRLGDTCASCHSTAGWKRRIGKFDHDRTGYALRGKHADLQCERCHEPGKPLQIEHFERCSDCHVDAHFGQLAVSAGSDCSDCHRVEGFDQVLFTVQDHQERTRYPLQGAHRQVRCSQCHQQRPVSDLAAAGLLGSVVPSATSSGWSGATVQLRFGSTACDNCHADPHQGQVASVIARAGCESCHQVQGWNETHFDHRGTRFPLEGKHAQVGCVQCHPRSEAAAKDAEAGPGKLQFTGLDTACAGCHEDQHRGQFATRGGATPCERCHDASAWKPTTFDHQKDSRFPLEGAHAAAACIACHPTELGDGDPFIRYKPRPLDCRGCHGGQTGRNASWP